ncbi:PSD1 and planctomycete cytochrome C domain-containing protein [Stieleria neptunia]|nr:PSD1 and planctomycete cytochrome C domain-containing protein [Stieleria neptunia]
MLFPSTATLASEVDFVRDVQPIFQQHCVSCHGAENQKSGLRLDIKSEAFEGGDGWGPSLIVGQADESPLIELVTSEDEGSRMPPEGEPLSATEIRTLTRWVDEGARWPDGVDLAELEDRMDHWSFQPMASPPIPDVKRIRWPRGAIDRFILARLEQDGLTPVDEADPVTWLRRTTFDLTGLPPTPQQVGEFLEQIEHGDAAYTAVVDRLLKSPRYGERWAQHWLDVVRYADTHGFEVNTERPHAWPYRDYVVAAMNADTPYDRFIKEQIVGDALGADAATGFLITASVLLPGQIGKDAPSIRLARQDALDEIVNNVSQTFLGLSVGCARCHDHKFDPISAKDYYSMQAFVAGVEYADREMRSPESDALKRDAKGMRRRVSEIDEQLLRFVPLAHPRVDRDLETYLTNAAENTETFQSLTAKYVRFTIHDANRHPSLGLIEPCVDEFQIFTDGADPQNVAIASHGTKVTASGSRTSANHKLEHVHDGQFGNARSWMSDEKGRGWLMFELPQPTRIAKIVWSRDRKQQYTDRLATAYTIEAGPSIEAMKTLKHVPPQRAAVSPSINVDRFAPVRAKRLRFTVLATNNLEPCLDELEVFNAAGQNIALADTGTKLTTSSDTIVADRHEPGFIHDGRYGNSRSWMSGQTGAGWVELEFAEAQEIVRVAWSRDRLGKFQDRLPTEYRIETTADQDWQLVADSSDRRAADVDTPSDRQLSTVGLNAEDAQQANRLMKEKRTLEAKIKTAERGKLAFAGKFRKPDAIARLNRGDPEQPREPVVPAVLSALGELALPAETAEQERRRALADWIASPQNRLTARVMVNRIWQWHFGTGLVDTPNDFGRNGSQPSHPQLLDWLAQEFIRSGWSIKHMHRLIVLSATYRQSTQSDAAAAAKDTDVRLLWRYPSRRLEAEAIRDGMLAASGQLNLKMGGRGFNLFNKRGGLSGFTPVESFTGDGLRRMIYAHKVRRERDAVFGAFDCPDAGQSTARRIESTTPIQALNLLNSRFTIDQAAAFAARLQTEAGEDLRQQIQLAYQIGFNREPDRGEMAEALPVVREYGLQTLCRAMFNSNEFLFFP